MPSIFVEKNDDFSQQERLFDRRVTWNWRMVALRKNCIMVPGVHPSWMIFQSDSYISYLVMNVRGTHWISSSLNACNVDSDVFPGLVSRHYVIKQCTPIHAVKVISKRTEVCSADFGRCPVNIQNKDTTTLFFSPKCFAKFVYSASIPPWWDAARVSKLN